MDSEHVVICPHRLTGMCRDPKHYQECGHGELHEPVKANGFHCTNADGSCCYTNYSVRCVWLAPKRIEGIKQLLLTDIETV